MARILAIDYGRKRTGLAVTDPLQIIATALDTVSTPELMAFLQQYLRQETVETLVLGWPTKLDGQDTDITAEVENLFHSLQKHFPDVPVHKHDERFTSKMALNALIEGGTSKKYRRQKANIDKVSAVIILQSFLESQSFGPSSP
ncbi:MAG: Holliday junction resolvase RuvX [Microscillaceae bacterium]|nr:Holliday junction resolvase RuvX [Microscillaceae bacterium]